MATVLTYNDIVLHNVTVREWRQEVVYDPSQTDRVRSRYTITVEGLIGQEYARAHYAAGKSVHDILRAVQLALAEPRRELRISLYTWGRPQQEEVIFRCAPCTAISDPDRDLANGPKPMEMRVVSVIGAAAYQVSITITCEKLEQPRGGEVKYLDGYQGPQPVLSNRWSVSEDFDSNLYCARTISGTMRMSTAAAITGLDYRWLAVPALEPGFKRERMRYAVSADGLEVTYEIIDRQWHTMPPWPCTDMRIRHSRETQYGVTAIARCEVQLTGAPDVPRLALVARLAQILDYFLGILRNEGEYAKSWHIRHAVIVEEIGQSNQVGAQVEIQRIGDPTHAGTGAGSGEFITNNLLAIGQDMRLDDSEIGAPHLPHRAAPGPYHPSLHEQPSPYGYNTWQMERSPAVQMLFHCYLQVPYRPPHGFGGFYHLRDKPGKQPEPEKTRVERVPAESLAKAKPDNYSKEHKDYLYTLYRARNRYRIDRRLVGCPLAKADGEGRTVAIVPLGGGVAVRSLWIDAERLGRWPELPLAEDFEIGQGQQKASAKLQRYAVEPLPPTPSPTGQGLVYRVRAYYRWIMDRVPPTDTVWPIGRLGHVEDRERQSFQLSTVSTGRVGPTDAGR